MREEVRTPDVTVVGGGLAGVCAAIAAARNGRTVALINNRPVLGGNSSSEVRVWVRGATAHRRHRFARENGIVGELLLQNQFTNPEGNPYYWDLVLLEAVRAEPNIELFLNTDVRDVRANGPDEARVIESVTGWVMGAERLIEFRAPVFLDCTGDGLVGFLAGADFRQGREARSEHDESWAPEVADDLTLGSTMLFYSKDIGRPVKFVPPSFAKDITATHIPETRVISSERDGCYNWWIEWGGELDSVHDNETIRDELWAVIYGIWDYIKNSGKFDAERLTLEWVGSVPGKREYRRFVGDHTMTQSDILNQVDFDDRVAFGGWSIDLHPEDGVYAKDAGSKHWHPDGSYHIPFRSLYSVNVSNLLFAGRDISASHVAFGSTRVIATCGATGEAAGAAAALCVETGNTPREVGKHHIQDLQRNILRHDGPLLGLEYVDPDDHAQVATVTASSSLQKIAIEAGTRVRPLEAPIGILVPVDPSLSSIQIKVDVSSPTVLSVSAHETGRAQNYVPASQVAAAEVAVEPGEGQWVTVPLPWQPDSPANAFVIVGANPSVSIHTAEEMHPGVLWFTRVDPSIPTPYPQPVLEWKEIHPRELPCLRLDGATHAYSAQKAVGGFARPFGGPQMWVSDAKDQEPWLELSWPSPIAVREIHLIFDDHTHEDLDNLHKYRVPWDAAPTLVKDYRLEALLDGQWRVLHSERTNHKRHRTHVQEEAVSASAVRVVVESTNGAACAHITSMRVY